MSRDKEQREIDSIMYKKEKVYIPKDDLLRAEIIRLHYDTPVGEHGGQWKTVELITRNFQWLGVTKKMKQYIEGYNAYQRNKNCTKQPAGKLIPNSIPEKPWAYILADFITKLLLEQEYNSILVVVDRLTKWYTLYQLQREYQQKGQQDCLEIICGSCMVSLKVLYLTGDHNSQQE